jgi:hypothetical protein
MLTTGIAVDEGFTGGLVITDPEEHGVARELLVVTTVDRGCNLELDQREEVLRTEHLLDHSSLKQQLPSRVHLPFEMGVDDDQGRGQSYRPKRDRSG